MYPTEIELKYIEENNKCRKWGVMDTLAEEDEKRCQVRVVAKRLGSIYECMLRLSNKQELF